MTTQLKIKIKDNHELRIKIDDLYTKSNQIILAKWSLIIAKRILKAASIDYKNFIEITEGFQVNKLWQNDKVRMYDVRQASFKIHKIARSCYSEIEKSAFRTAGHAVASGHIREHAMVASDYAIKTIGLITKNDIKIITKERRWQFNELDRLFIR